jgi:hypothetical protein
VRIEPQPDGTLVKALARAWRWQRMLALEKLARFDSGAAAPRARGRSLSRNLTIS